MVVTHHFLSILIQIIYILSNERYHKAFTKVVRKSSLGIIFKLGV